jgi:hypothetical protein
MPALRKRADAIARGREAPRLSLLLDLEHRAVDLGTAAHEATHQLVASSGLAPRHDAFPTWLHEGLAAQFEVVRGGRWAGVGRANDLRLPDWRALRPTPALAPLARGEGFGHGYRRDLYAEAWSLVFFLRKAHPREFIRYIDLLQAPTAEPSSDARSFELFRTSFGTELSPLEAEWHRYLRTVLTPVEAPATPESARFHGTRD